MPSYNRRHRWRPRGADLTPAAYAGITAKGGGAVVQTVIVTPGDLPVPPVQGGSVQIYAAELCRAFSALEGCGITLISPGPTRGERAEDLHRLRCPAHIHIRASPAEYRDAVMNTLAALAPDVIQIENRPNWLLGVHRMCPMAKIVLNLHSLTYLSARHIAPAELLRAVRVADAITVNSEFLRQRVSQRVPVDRRHIIEVIHPGVHLAHYAPPGMGRPATDRQRDGDTLQLLYVGRILEQKGLHVLLEAVRRVHQCKMPIELNIVGRAPAWQTRYLQRLEAAARPLPVRWQGFVPPHAIAPQYWQADVLLCPSQWDESFGLVNLEALAAGIPVIASELGGIREIITPDCGLLVHQYHSAQAFADAIWRLGSNPALREQLRRGTQTRAAQFPWERTARRFLTLYETLSQARHDRAAPPTIGIAVSGVHPAKKGV